jgi:polyphosphate kinase
MNALLEPSVIEALYQASQAGVEIDLIVRGLSILRPGVKGLSERIRVRSIVGRFLEHSRIFHFANGGNDEIYLGSADWMPRNLFERCEVVFPVRDPAAWPAFTTRFCPPTWPTPSKPACSSPTAATSAPAKLLKDAKPFASQDFLMQLAEGKADLDAIPNAKAAARKAHAAD